ncbi:MAG: hypothetical protein A2513_10585 [Sulfurimonas sp. RIFOXYD12_FULL_33_39]|uniref:hypothetical protein n=1 Tax=unclassified Sulfurimonas TaxID=2623549 RepID=UPI0008D79D76|nr:MULTISPECIES: hypothetical protein [unclassified Sulfurimonas]OHE09754.1 MAG: hypothetical protein A2513_10585 [Sulfurimonas sp. RIFOXYD12_FULL_33_39]OHE13738.1 MAG: hypothetical protein A2530_09170 [Sulfurimonas sp. RIFOXYD2_FULL_34_21]DAB27933.1 MAG TPA: hypothetical protein CFH78_05110 [Sulfurimonas sp. UBA10385]
MKKIVLSTIAALAVSATSLSAAQQFYVDDKGQVFTTSAADRIAIKSDETSVFSKSSKLEFSGTHYLGFVNKDMKSGDTTNNFEMRRNYVQVKAYVMDDPKSYLRVTLDATYSNSTANGEGHANAYVKYAYLYLNNILPYTGVEFGMAHRPWIDYEEHQGWWMRSISKVFVEADEAAHLTNSADLGVNFKTKTPYFTSEVGIFNGEGYHGTNDSSGANDEELGDGVSAEWRFTAALLGNGDKKRKPLKDTYFDASFFGQYNMDNSHNASSLGKSEDYKFYGLHTVYNMPSFLIAAQYVTSDNDLANDSNWNGQGYSVNGTYRFGEKKEFSAFARYDEWENENTTTGVISSTEKNAIYGVAWQQNKNFKWLLSGQSYNIQESNSKDWDSVMLTAEVHW